MKNLSLKIIALTFLSISFFSCDSDEKNADLNLNITGLENLGNEYIYEGWIIVDGNPISTGFFSVDDNGNMSQNEFSIDKSDLESASTFVLTIEPSPDNDPAPSSVHVLAGDFGSNSASLTISHPAALGDDFSTAAGQYILATPTDGGSMDNEDSGVWFLDPSGPSATLDLPTLPAGWAYEGWAVINGAPVSTGTFTSVDQADDAAPYSGSAGGPPFPGEDFLVNAPANQTFPTSLLGSTIVISVEPVPDNSPNPFTLKPLAAAVPSDLEPHTLAGLNNNISNTPIQGTATRK